MSYTKERIDELTDEMDNELREHYEGGNAWYRTTSRNNFQDVLITCIKFASLYDSYTSDPSLFNLERLTDDQKYILLESNYRVFSKCIDITKIENRYIVMLFLKRKSLHSKVNWSKVTKKDYATIAMARPGYFREYKLPFEKLSGKGWGSLFNYDKSHITEFLDNIQYVKNKTDLRSLLTQEPQIIKELTVSSLEKSVLNAKDCVLFFARTEGAEPSKEVQEWLDMEFHMEVLAGESTVTSYTSRARKKEGAKDGNVSTKV